MLHPSFANLSNSAPHLISRDTDLRSLSRFRSLGGFSALCVSGGFRALLLAGIVTFTS